MTYQWRWSLQLLLALLLCLAPEPVACMEGEIITTVGPQYLVRWAIFGTTGPGASFLQTISITSSAPPGGTIPSQGVWMWAVIASSDEFNNILADDVDVFCASNVSAVSLAAQRLGWPGSLNSSFDIAPVGTIQTGVSVADYYSFLLISCSGSLSFDVDIQYHLLNPGGEELSAGRIPLKGLSLGLLGAWVGVGCLLLSSAACARCAWAPPADALVAPAGPVRALHWALMGVPVLSVAHLAIAYVYVVDASRTGAFSDLLGLATSVTADVATGALVAAILALSRGWQITRGSLDAAELRQILLVTSLYTLVFACFQVIGGFFFLFVLVLVYVLLLRYAFASVSWRLRVLATWGSYLAEWFASGGFLGRGRRGAGANGGGGPVTTTVASLRSPSSRDEEDEGGALARRGAAAATGAGGGDASSSAAASGGDAMSVPVAMAPPNARGGGEGASSVQASSADSLSSSSSSSSSVSPLTAAGPSRSHVLVAEGAAAGKSVLPALPAAPLSSYSASPAAAPPPIAASPSSSDGEGLEMRAVGAGGAVRALPFSAQPAPSSALRGATARGGLEAEEEEEEEERAGAEDERAGLVATAPTPAAAAGAPAAGAAAAPPSWFDRLPWSNASRARQAALDSTLSDRQIHALRYFRSAIVIFLSADVILQMWSVLALVETPWLGFLLEELNNFAMLIYLWVLFRPRADPHAGVLFDASGYEDDRSQRLLLALVEGSEGGYGSGGGREAEGGGGAAAAGGQGGAADADDEAPRFLVVQNPDSIGSNGELIPSVSIAELNGHGRAAANSRSSSDGPSSMEEGVTYAVRTPRR